MFGSASSPGQLRHSDSSQSINRKMWDSSGELHKCSTLASTHPNSDPTRNPAPLPLPDHHAPISGVRTQTKVAAAHKRLTTTTSSRSLTQLLPDSEESAPNLYDLVSTIHTNLEILMKRSQNNARDLGKLRGDVKNPQAIEEIKKLLQDSSNVYANVDSHDSERRKELESELAAKVDALLKTSLHNADRPSTPTVAPLPDAALMAQFSSAVTSAASAAVSSSQVVEQLDEMQGFLKQHLPIHIPQSEPCLPAPQLAPEPPMVVSIDTTALEATVKSLNSQILIKVEELQRLDTALLGRRSELAHLEVRATTLQTQVNLLLTQMTDARTNEERRLRDDEELREKKESTLRTKKSKRALMPLAPSHDRRIVSLSNVASTPTRKPPPPSTGMNGELAAPLKHESPFSQRPVLINNQAHQAENELEKVRHKPMQMTLRSAPVRKTSWSRRVSQIFVPSNKENTLLDSVNENRVLSSSSKEGLDVNGEHWNSIGRGMSGIETLKGSMKSFRSFSHR